MRFLWFIIGIIIGAYGMRLYERREYARGGYVSAPGAANDTWSGRIRQWHLTPDDIRGDLDRTGEVVRSNADVVGQKLDDARIVATIKAKYLLDRDLSAIDIHVQSREGDVLLTGTVASPALIGRAVAMALDTGGVHRVVARLHPKG